MHTYTEIYKFLNGQQTLETVNRLISECKETLEQSQIETLYLRHDYLQSLFITKVNQVKDLINSLGLKSEDIKDYL